MAWCDVDWERNRITIHSPKTEAHEGGASRQVPLFSELRGPLNEVWKQAEPGTEFVITRCRSTSVNLRTELQRIIRRAGLTPWPKLWQNLRATRQTELVQKYPIHLVCYWLGNSALVAKKHYLQIRDEDFAAAATDATPETGGAPSGAPDCGTVARQAAQPAEGSDCLPSRNRGKSKHNKEFSQAVAVAALSCPIPRVPPAGFEPATNGLEIHCSIP